jgi:hypothetical protein
LDGHDLAEGDSKRFSWDWLTSEPWELSRNLVAADMQPLFLMAMLPEVLRAVAFGHLRVAFVLDIPKWLSLIGAQGLDVKLRSLTKREKADKLFKTMLLHAGQRIVVRSGGSDIALGNGYKARMILEAARPQSVAEMIASANFVRTP